MNLDILNKWLTLVANLGVMGGLVLVAMQMNLNTATIRLQNELELNRELAAGELAYMGDSAYIAFAVAQFHPGELTEAQLGQVWAYLHVNMLAAQNNWLAYRSGLGSQDSWAHAKSLAIGYLGFRAGRIWWEHDKFEYESDFVEQIDAELAGSDPVDLEHTTRQMLDEIHGLDQIEAKLSPSSRSSSTLSATVPRT